VIRCCILFSSSPPPCLLPPPPLSLFLPIIDPSFSFYHYKHKLDLLVQTSYAACAKNSGKISMTMSSNRCPPPPPPHCQLTPSLFHCWSTTPSLYFLSPSLLVLTAPPLPPSQQLLLKSRPLSLFSCSCVHVHRPLTHWTKMAAAKLRRFPPHHFFVPSFVASSSFLAFVHASVSYLSAPCFIRFVPSSVSSL
jgi:hypothetical protein